MSLSLQLNLLRDNFKLRIDCSIESHGVTAIYGHSGSGKTTLLRWIAGLEHGTAGQLQFNDTIWQDQHTFVKPEQRLIAYVFQDARLFPHLDVSANLNYAYQRRCKTGKSSPSITQVCDWLQLAPLLSQSAATLSGGQQQRVAIGRALLSNPQLILMDEPLGALDKKSREHILQLLEQLDQHINVPMLYVSHSIEEVSRIADNLIIIEEGQLIAQGSLLELCHRLDLQLAHEDNAASIIEGQIDRYDDRYDLSELIVDGQHRLYLSRCTAPEGTSLHIRVPARDISISLQHHSDSSILNILPCTISAIESSPKQNSSASRVLIKLQLGQQYLLARLTHKSADRLQLQIGQTVFAQIKSVALLNDRNLIDHNSDH